MDLFALLAPIIILELILAIVAIIAWVKTEETRGPKWLWLVIILFVSILGPILFFIIGRRQD